MTFNLKTTGPLKLPKAPKGYDVRDQDHTRRLIELALIAYTRQLASTIDAIGAVTNPVPLDFVPVSPYHGTASSLGNAGGTPPVCQLQNPQGSGKLFVIYEMKLSQDGTATTRLHYRTSDTPAAPNGGTVTAGTITARDEANVTASVATLRAFDICTPNPPMTSVPGGGANVWDVTLGEAALQAAQAGILYTAKQMVSNGQHPIVLLPGQTLEASTPTTGATERVTMYVCWDELPLATDLGTPSDWSSAPISSCFAGVRAQGSINDGPFFQFFNPGPRYARVTGLFVMCDATNFTAVRRTAEPINIAGGGAAITVGLPKRMNRASIEPVYCTLKGTNITANANDFHTATAAGDSFWRDKGRAVVSGLPYEPVISPFGAPIIVKPNSAIEISVAATGTVFAGVFLMWDELDSV